MAVTPIDFAVFLFYSMEIYHAVVHSLILFGLRTLPRKDFVQSSYYFFMECSTVFVSAFLLLGRFHLMVMFHIVMHLFYYFTWDKSNMAKKLIDWSCLERYQDKYVLPVQLDSTFLTVYDCVVHIAMVFLLGQQLHWTGIILGILVASSGLRAVVFSPRFAWSHPNHMPAWVEKRLGSLALKYD